MRSNILLKTFRKLKKKERKFVENLSERDKKLYEVLIFLIKFTMTAGLLHFLLWMNVDMTWLQEIVAGCVAHVLNLVGYAAIANGVIVHASGVSVEIIRDCVGWKSFLAIFGLIIASPRVRWEHRLAGILGGALIIFVMNIMRLVTTIMVGIKYGTDLMDVVHIHLWRWGLTAVVIAYWYVWYLKCSSVIGDKRKV